MTNRVGLQESANIWIILPGTVVVKVYPPFVWRAGLGIVVATGEDIRISERPYPNSLTVPKSYYAVIAAKYNAQKNQILMPIIMKKRAHHPFIKRPATIANIAKIVVGTAMINRSHSPCQQDPIKTHKGAMFNTAQLIGTCIKGLWKMLRNIKAKYSIRTAHTRYVQTSVLI
jgi:hypothetical protein